MVENFCKYCILQGAEIFPLNISSDDAAHLGICNPSILNDGENVYLTLRNVNYLLYDNKNLKYQSNVGQFVYCTPDDDDNLRTRNYLCKYNITDNTINEYNLIDTSDFDVEPNWIFIGHEDVRLVRWNDKLYVTGCRRDIKDNGESRMELCEIDENTGKELSRLRIKAPGDNSSYCEKNWMPILDMPYHYVKWTNPTEIVKINPETGDSETILLKEQNQEIINTHRALRGSSQLIPYKDGYIALLHEVDLWFTELKRKSAQYYMKWVIFDKEFNITHTSDEFKFLNFSIEFTNGLMYKDKYFYIPFSVMDNVSFMLKVPEHVVYNFITNEKDDSRNDYQYIVQQDNIYKNICINNNDANNWFELGEMLLEQKHYSQAGTMYARALENNNVLDDEYKYAYCFAKAFSGIGHRDSGELAFWENCILIDSSRSEAYENIARYYKWRKKLHTAYLFSKMAYELNNYKPTTKYNDIDPKMSEILYYELMYNCGPTADAHIKLIELKNKLVSTNNNNINNFYISYINSLLNTIEKNKKNIQKAI